MDEKNKNEDFAITPKLVFDLNLALYLDLVAALESAGAVTYRQMAARVLNVSMSALMSCWPSLTFSAVKVT